MRRVATAARFEEKLGVALTTLGTLEEDTWGSPQKTGAENIHAVEGPCNAGLAAQEGVLSLKMGL